MSKKEMIEYKESFITKVKNFFKRLFKDREEKYNYIQDKTIENKKEKQDSFIDNILVNINAVDSVIEKNTFLKEINGNEKALNMLSIERLEKLEKYYDEIIEENDKKIKRLKAVG